MSAMVENYSKHGDIEEYIIKNHPKSEKYKQYRNRWNNNKNDLLYLLFETVSACNLKCVMCAHSFGYEQTPRMSDEIFDLGKKAIKEMDIPSICINQCNEPLLDKKLFERLKELEKIENIVDVHMNSNGLLLDEGVAEKILDSNITKLFIGFDAFSKDIYEQVRVGSNYDKVIKNIQYLIDLKEKRNQIFPIIRISFVRTSINEKEIEDWYHFWKDKVDYITLQEYLSPVLDKSKNNLISENSKRKIYKVSEITCNSPFERAIIRGDGHILPCCAPFATQMSLGNILDNKLQDIWNGETANSLRHYFTENKWLEHPLCSQCLKISYEIEETNEALFYQG